MASSFSWVRRSVDPIGLDYGSRVVRMIQLSRQRGQLSVVAAAERELPVSARSAQELDAMRTELASEMLAQGDFVGKDVISALCWDHLHIRNVRIPQMPEEEIGEAIRFEASERFGLDPMNAEFRFMLAGEVRQGTEMKQEVIAFGASRAVVDEHIAGLTKIGLHPVSIDAGACAMFRSFERYLRRAEDANEVNVFLDLGYSASRLVVSRGPDLIFYKSIPIGGRRLDELTAEHLSLSIAEAARLRIRHHARHVVELTGRSDLCGADQAISQDEADSVIQAIRPGLEQLAKEISLCFRYCAVTFRGVRSSPVTVVGGEACNRDILNILSEQVNVRFEIGQPMRGIGTEGIFDGVNRRSGQPEWSTAIGLALKPVSAALEVAT